ncbi:Sugar kinase of the NBD/HSP70 family, may contain an N-terminal HTH domain [Variovorax sp. HW608]|nr:Sugar kinase of the NBD/HSP70 family, may contain an N-terminal HTH domain [Variovorax sp. HW608]
MREQRKKISTPSPVTGDQAYVKSINRIALLRLLREHAGISRADLSERSGLTRSTVSLLIKELIDEGWLVEADAFVTGTAGRRPTPLKLAGKDMVLLGVDLGPDAIRVVATSIHGEILEASQAALRSKDPDEACHQLVEMATALSAKMARGGSRLLGIGVGLHGPVDKRSGMLEFAPNIGWRHVEIGRRLGAELAQAGLADVPVYYHNEADLAAVGETEFCERPVDDPLVYVSCGVGVGAGIILNHALFTGASGSAGEIGHTTLVIEGQPCSCGRLGCAEAYIGLKAIAAAAGCFQDDVIDRRALRARMSSRNPATRAAFARAGAYLGVLLQNVWTTFNPQVIVLGGETVTFGGDTLLDAASEVLSRYAERAGLIAPVVKTARHSDLATAVGGAAFVLHAMFNPHQPALHSQYVPAPDSV